VNKQIKITLTEETLERLRGYSVSKNVPRNDVVARALEAFMSERPGATFKVSAHYIESLLDNAATAAQNKDLLRTDDDAETSLREAVRINVVEPLLAQFNAVIEKEGE
jgi:hypothetical protein